jgi:hypothetical protein
MQIVLAVTQKLKEDAVRAVPLPRSLTFKYRKDVQNHHFELASTPQI